ncbi:unannotated protein [freshwater metagenome]|uniref:Unannotated protein n=1 Tax=freshwater metagenome TaxID=449393 RepID=A0A6J6WSS5_9ZZZZ
MRIPKLRWTDNEVYGHGLILREYCDIHRDQSFRVHVQHGWNPSSGWTLAGKEILPPKEPRVVWSSRQIAYSDMVGIRVRAAIGAPFIYLDQLMAAGQMLNHRSSNGTLAFPYHGNERDPVSANHRNLAAQIEERETSSAHICLYSTEWNNHSIRSIYKEKFENVFTLGNRENRFFLQHLYFTLGDYKRAASNRFSTALLYAAHLGLRTEVYGAEARIAGEFDGLGAQGKLTTAFPEIHRREISSDEGMQLAQEELGIKFLRAPAELAEILGLSSLAGRFQAGKAMGVYAARRATVSVQKR